jgi:hypothetical protein
LLNQALGQFAPDTPGIGHLLLARGRWRAAHARLAEAISDLAAALRASDNTGDYLTRGQARQQLRVLREGDQQASFDQARAQALGPLPAWLRYPATSEPLSNSVIAWVQTPDWPGSRTYLRNNAAALLTDQAEAALEHLIDANPANGVLRYHLELLQDARAHGGDAAYAAQQQQRDTQARVRLLTEWIATPAWAASRDFATANADALLDPATQAVLAASGEHNLRNPQLRLHRGLLDHATTAGLGCSRVGRWRCTASPLMSRRALATDLGATMS